MKKFLNYELKIKDDQIIIIVLSWFAFLFLVYLGAMFYVVIDYMNSDTIKPRDAVAAFVIYKLHRKVGPFLKSKVFVRR